MKQIGGLMAFLGAFAIVLDFVGRVPSFLFWIYNWGDSTAWVIKIALIVVGGALYLMAGSNNDDAPE